MLKKFSLLFLAFFFSLFSVSCKDKRDFNLDTSAIDRGVFAKEYLNAIEFDESVENSFVSNDDASQTHIKVFTPKNVSDAAFFRTIDISTLVADKKKKSVKFGPLFYYHPFFNNSVAYSNNVIYSEKMKDVVSSLTSFNYDIFKSTSTEVLATEFKETTKTIKISYLPLKYQGYQFKKKGDVAPWVVTAYLLVPYAYNLDDKEYNDASFTSDNKYKVLTFDSTGKYLALADKA